MFRVDVISEYKMYEFYFITRYYFCCENLILLACLFGGLCCNIITKINVLTYVHFYEERIDLFDLQNYKIFLFNKNCDFSN